MTIGLHKSGEQIKFLWFTGSGFVKVEENILAGRHLYLSLILSMRLDGVHNIERILIFQIEIVWIKYVFYLVPIGLQ